MANLSQNGTTVKLVLNKIVLRPMLAAGGHNSLHLAPLPLMITESIEKSVVSTFVKCTKPYCEEELIFITHASTRNT